MNSYNYNLFCFVKNLFCLYIYLVISSLVFIFMFGVASQLLFYCDRFHEYSKYNKGCYRKRRQTPQFFFSMVFAAESL